MSFRKSVINRTVRNIALAMRSRHDGAQHAQKPKDYSAEDETKGKTDLTFSEDYGIENIFTQFDKFNKENKWYICWKFKANFKT